MGKESGDRFVNRGVMREGGIRMRFGLVWFGVVWSWSVVGSRWWAIVGAVWALDGGRHCDWHGWEGK